MNIDKIKKQLSTGLSWLFNNNGNEIDWRYRRISDHSPVNSTGIHRLIGGNSWIYAAAIVGPMAIGSITSPKDVKTDPFLILWPAVNVIGLRKFKKYNFAQNNIDPNAICIDIKPDKTTLKPSAFSMETIKDYKSMSLVGTLGGSALTIYSSLAALGGTFQTASDVHQTHKILRDDWRLTEIPPPKKKESPSSDLGQFLAEIT